MKLWCGKRSNNIIGAPVFFTKARRHNAAVLFTLALFSGAVYGEIQTLKACPQRISLCEGAPCVGTGGRSDDAWHGVARCLREIRNFWARNGPNYPIYMEGLRKPIPLRLFARDIVIAEMKKKRAQFKVKLGSQRATVDFSEVFYPDFRLRQSVDFVVLINDIGQPYNAMGQSGIAYFLYQLARLSAKGGFPDSDRDSTFYLTLAEGAITAVITPVEQGGLLSRVPCATAATNCAWFHSITRRDKQTREGATLNQNLHAIRDMGMISDLLAKQGWHADLKLELEKAITEGLNQLFEPKMRKVSGELPTLLDFFSPSAGKDQVNWIYYGLNLTSTPPKGGYFLSKDSKDCHYQIHNLELLARILERADRTGALNEQSTAMGCSSAVAKMYGSTKIRLGDSDSLVLSGPESMNHTRCLPETAKAFNKIDQGYYTRSFSRCVK